MRESKDWLIRSGDNVLMRQSKDWLIRSVDNVLIE